MGPGFGPSSEESSFFSSVPLGFYILGSMLMLIGAKYITGQCVFYDELERWRLARAFLACDKWCELFCQAGGKKESTFNVKEQNILQSDLTKY